MCSVDGQVFVRPYQFDPFLRALDGALATFGATRVALPTETSRAPRACFALPSSSTSFRAGTRRTYMTLLTSSPQTQAPRRWGQPSALASTSVHARGSQCVPVTRCTLRLAALITPPPRWSSQGNALMSPSLCITCASTGTCWTRTCWSLLTDSCGPLSALRSMCRQEHLTRHYSPAQCACIMMYNHIMAQVSARARHVFPMVIHDVRLIDRLFSLCSSPCSFPCVSPIPCSSLSTSTCTLS